MIMNDKLNNITTNIDDAVQMKVDMNESLYSTLSDKLYTNPIQSIIRELLSNAIDANIAAKTKNEVQVHFPSYVDPIFFVKDFGIGMTKEELIDVFAVYGKSSKRDSNDQIGGLGLGAKTPFSYKKNGSVFTVESAKNGKKNTILFFKNQNNIPCYKWTGEEDTLEQGTKISFFVDKSDFDEFIKESVIVFLFAMQMPEILNGKDLWLDAAGFNNFDEVKQVREILKRENLDVDVYNFGETDEEAKLLKRVARNLGQNSVVEMGGVAYEVDYSLVFDKSNYNTLSFVKNDPYFKVYHFPIGSLAIQASREKLNYTEDTINQLRGVIVNRFAKRGKKMLDAA